MAKNYKTGVLITGDASKGVRAIKLTRDEVKKLNTSQQRGAAQAKRYKAAQSSVSASIMRAGVVITAGAVAMTAMTKKALNSADAIGKQADQVGLSTDAWQEYIFAASQSGVSQDKLTSGMGALNKRVGELKQGTGSLNTFLKAYDEELYESVKASKSTGEAADLIFKAMGKAETSMDRAALSAAAFSRGAGIEMQNMVRGGAGALEDMREKAQELGIVLDESIIRNAEEMNDKLDISQRIISAQMNTALVELGPLLVAASAGMADLARYTALLFDSLKTTNEMTSIENLKDRMADLQLELNSINDDLNNFDITDIFGDDSALRERKENVMLLMGQVQHQIAKLNGEYDNLNQPIKKVVKNVNELGNGLNKGKSEISAHDKAMQSWVNSIDSAVLSDDLLIEKMATLDRWFQDGYISAELYADELKKLGDDTVALASETDGAVSEMGEAWDNMVVDVQRAWGDLFADNFKSVLDGGELSFESFADSILDMFIDMIARMAAAWAAEAILGGGFSSANALFAGLGGKISAGASALFGGAATQAAPAIYSGTVGPAAAATIPGAAAAGTAIYSGTVGPAAAATIPSSGLGAAGVSSTMIAAGALAALAIAGFAKQASNEAERAKISSEAMSAHLSGSFQTTETAFLGMSDATTSFTQNLDHSQISAHSLATDADIMTAAYRSVGIAVERGANGLLKMTGSVKKVTALTEAYNSTAASGMQQQINYQAQLLANMDDGVIRGYHMEEAIASVTAEFSKSALEAKGLASAADSVADSINSIPTEVTTVHTIVTENAEGSNYVSTPSASSSSTVERRAEFATGTGGWLKVPYDGYTPTFHKDELFNVIPKSDVGKSAQPVNAGSSQDNREIAFLLNQIVIRLDAAEGTRKYGIIENGNGHSDTQKRILAGQQQ